MPLTLSPATGRPGRASISLDATASGVAAGLLAATIWATAMVFAKIGTAGGLLPQDFVLLRFGGAALVMLPWLARCGAPLAGVEWGRGLVLTLLAGPPFILLSTGGYRFAPLAHGAVIQPSTIALGSMAAAALLLKERATPGRLAGVALILAGLAVIAGHADAMGGGMVWIGDLMFVAAGLAWAGFTILIKRWELGAMQVTAAVSTLSALVIAPAALIAGDFGRLAALPLPALGSQVIVQGVLSGVVAVIAFGIAVQRLGAAKAGLFPAIMPAITLLLGAVVGGKLPSFFDITGAALATLGLLAAVALPRPRRSPTAHQG